MVDTNEHSTHSEAASTPRWPANRLIVSIERQGLEVPTFTLQAPMVLGTPEMLLLDALNRPGGASRDEAMEFAASPPRSASPTGNASSSCSTDSRRTPGSPRAERGARSGAGRSG